jgi:hypothetical protein
MLKEKVVTIDTPGNLQKMLDCNKIVCQAVDKRQMIKIVSK